MKKVTAKKSTTKAPSRKAAVVAKPVKRSSTSSSTEKSLLFREVELGLLGLAVVVAVIFALGYIGSMFFIQAYYGGM